MKLNSGQILDDRYQIQRQLSDRPGRKTYLALDLQTQILVVLKLMYLSETLGWDDFKLFEREAQVLQVISHPAIPQYLDSFDVEPEKGLALVQTYIEARSLKQYLQAGRSSIRFG
jgi:serine/threonine protein kinase